MDDGPSALCLHSHPHLVPVIHMVDHALLLQSSFAAIGGGSCPLVESDGRISAETTLLPFLKAELREQIVELLGAPT